MKRLTYKPLEPLYKFSTYEAGTLRGTAFFKMLDEVFKQIYEELEKLRVRQPSDKIVR